MREMVAENPSDWLKPLENGLSNQSGGVSQMKGSRRTTPDWFKLF